MKTSRVTLIIAGWIGTALPLSTSAAVEFAKEVVPILQARCIECHGPDKQKGKLRLDSKADFLKGGKNGAIVKAGNAAESELHRRIILPKDDDDRMPSEGEPLTAEQIAILKNWIEEGATWPDDAVIQVANAKPSPPAVAQAGNLVPQKPVVPAPELPKDFKPAPDELTVIASLAKNGIDVRPVAQNVPWHEVNLRPLGTNVTDETIQPVKDLPSLIEVRLGATKITDAGLASLGSLPYLQVLGLELTGVTDAGLAHLSGLTNLTSLNLYGTPVSDAGLQHLQGMKHLRNVYLWQTKVTPVGTAQLQEALPGLNINTGTVFVVTSTNAPAEKKEEAKKDEAKKDEEKEKK